MNWEQWICPNQLCGSEAWMVQQNTEQRDLWQVAPCAGDGPYTVAAIVPVCPRCGTTLSATLELTGAVMSSEVAPIDVVRRPG